MNSLKCYLAKAIYSAFFPAVLLSISPIALSQTAATFDIDRYSTAGAGQFETFYIDETQALRAALDSGLVEKNTALLVTETATGNMAMIRDQMAFHHIAQGRANGIAWMATF